VRQPAEVVGCFFTNVLKTKPSMKILIESDGQGGLNYEIQGDAVQLNKALRVMYWNDPELRKAINALCVELAPARIRAAEEVANISDASVGKTPAGERHQPKI
jgi:hypothetical protein